MRHASVNVPPSGGTDRRSVPAAPEGAIWRVGLIAACIPMALAVGTAIEPREALRLLLFGVPFAAFAVFGWRLAPGRESRIPALLLALIAVPIVVSSSIKQLQIFYNAATVGTLAHAGIALMIVAAAVAVLAPAWPARIGFVLLVAWQVTVLVIAIRAGKPLLDAWEFQQDSGAALLHGHNPFTLTFADPYGPEATRLFYAPGLVSNGRLCSVSRTPR